MSENTNWLSFEIAKIISPEVDGVVLTFLTHWNPYIKIKRFEEEYNGLEKDNIHHSFTNDNNVK